MLFACGDVTREASDARGAQKLGCSRLIRANWLTGTVPPMVAGYHSTRPLVAPFATTNVPGMLPYASNATALITAVGATHNPILNKDFTKLE
jgi:hypothetical protein